MTKPTWTTADGRVLPIDTMETSHLQRVIYMMMRGMRWVCVKDAMDAFGYAATTGGEFAADAAWQAGDELMTIADEPEEMFEKVKKERRIARLMLAELRKRKVSFKEDQWMLPEDQAALAQRLAKKRKKT